MSELPLLALRSLQQSLAPQRQPRVPEPTALLLGDERLDAFDAGADETNLAAIHAFAVEIAAALAPPAGNALDVACGAGQVLERLSARLPSYRYWGVDLDHEMLVRAQRRLAAASRHVRWLEGDMGELGAMPDCFFQLTTCVLSLHHASGPEHATRVLQEMHRVTHPDGALLILDLGRLKTPGLNRWYADWAGREYGADLREELHQSLLAAYTPDELKALAEASGVPGLIHRSMAALPVLQVLYRPGVRAAEPEIVDPPASLVALPPAAQRDFSAITSLFRRVGVEPRRLARLARADGRV